MKNSIYHLRLVNGDEIITKVTKKTKTLTYVYEPLFVEEIKNPETGQSSILLTKYLLSDDNLATFNNAHVISFSSVNKSIEKYYHVSLEYNKKFIEGQKLNEIEKVTKFMNGLVNKNPEEKTLILKKTDIDLSRVFLGSNTVN